MVKPFKRLERLYENRCGSMLPTLTQHSGTKKRRIKSSTLELGEMAQWVRVLAALLEYQVGFLAPT